MDAYNYSETVKKLFALGEPGWHDWMDYSSIGLNEAHINELLHIVQNTSAIWDEAEDVEWAPTHACRALAQLRAVEAFDALIHLHETEGENDWIGEDIPVALATLGAPVIAKLREYLCNLTNNSWTRIAASHALEIMSVQYPETRADCIAAQCAGLELFEQNEEDVNAFIISFLADMNAPETAPLVERAFQSGNVDLTIMGDYEEFQIAVGLLEERITPAPRYGWIDPEMRLHYEEMDAAIKQINKTVRASEKKEKNKRKQEKKSRKKNRKK
jgi:hypothetical protein